MPEQDRNNDYDSEPVVYCAKCLSLKIEHEDNLDIDCCGNCGSTDVIESSFNVWERRYEAKYGKKFAVKNDNPRNSPIFKLSLTKLMAKVSDCPKWESIIKDVYGHFPKGISKADSIVMFFDRLIRDNKLDSLRLLLYKMKI